MDISCDAQRRKLELSETVALTNDKTQGFTIADSVINDTNDKTIRPALHNQIDGEDCHIVESKADFVEDLHNTFDQKSLPVGNTQKYENIDENHELSPANRGADSVHTSESSVYMEPDFFIRNSPIQNKENITWKIEIGTVLENRYQIIEKIGTGGTATVFKALHTTLGNVWAVKVLPSADETLNEHLKEAEILKHLNHPMLPRIADIIVTSACTCIVMDYLEGENLLQVINEQGKLPEKSVQMWMSQICDVLTYLHLQKPEPIIYRDLKPSNLIAGKDGHVKLIDFGTARAYRVGVDGDTAYIGTQGYASPEQFGLNQSDCRTDLYNLGMTMFHLLTGIHPVSIPHSKIEAELLNAHISPKLVAAIVKCTELLPSQRFQSAQLCKEFLFNKEDTEISQSNMSIGQNSIRNSQKGKQLTGQTRIAIVGACSGVGVTFLSLLLSSFFARKKQSVAFVELNTSGDFNRLQSTLISSGHLSKKESSYFSFQKIDFHPGCRKTTDIRGSRYRVTIADIGSRPNGTSLEEFYRSEWQFVYCPHAEWKTGRVVEFFEKYDSQGNEKQFIYVVQAENEQQLRQMKLLFGNRTVVGLPYIQNPFELTKMEIKKLERFIETIGMVT